MSAYNAEAPSPGYYARTTPAATTKHAPSYVKHSPSVATYSSPATSCTCAFHPASAPRRSKALAALCTELTDTTIRYPGTDLTLAYRIKRHPDAA